MKHLYFVRHGESVRNVQHIFAGQFDTLLTDHGREEAEIAGGRAKHIHIDLIVSSPLSRALETAQIIARAVGYPAEKILVDEAFKERSLGTLEGKSWDEYAEEADATNGAETDDELLVRARKGLEFLRSLPAENVLLVGHGSFSKALRTAIDPSHGYDEPENAQIVQLL